MRAFITAIAICLSSSAFAIDKPFVERGVFWDMSLKQVRVIEESRNWKFVDKKREEDKQPWETEPDIYEWHKYTGQSLGITNSIKYQFFNDMLVGMEYIFPSPDPKVRETFKFILEQLRQAYGSGERGESHGYITHIWYIGKAIENGMYPKQTLIRYQFAKPEAWLNGGIYLYYNRSDFGC